MLLWTYAYYYVYLLSTFECGSFDFRKHALIGVDKVHSSFTVKNKVFIMVGESLLEQESANSEWLML